MNLKEAIVNILNNKPIQNNFLFVQIPHNNSSELDPSDLLSLCIPFVNAKFLELKSKKEESLEEFENYIFYISDLIYAKENYFTFKKLSEIYENVKENSEISRNDKIFMYQIKKSFQYDFIDWEDKKWILSLLSYFYVLSIEIINFLKMELSFLEIKKEKESISIKKINRKELLTNRIKPKYTLEQFGDMLLKKINEKDPPQTQQKIELSLEEIRKLDELKDEKHNKRGHTENIG